MTAPGASTTTYVHGLTVNGRSWAPAWLPASLLTGADAPARAAGRHPAGVHPLAHRRPVVGRRRRRRAAVVPGRAAAFPPGRKPVILTPTGPNLLGDPPTGQLAWQGPVENGVGSVPGTVAPATTPEGASAVAVDRRPTRPPTPGSGSIRRPSSPAGQSYQASITLEGTGSVYLDFWNGQQDLTSQTVQLTGTPQTLTVQGPVPSAADTHLQIRTADPRPRRPLRQRGLPPGPHPGPELTPNPTRRAPSFHGGGPVRVPLPAIRGSDVQIPRRDPRGPSRCQPAPHHGRRNG